MKRQVIVVGAGPAGSSAAFYLAKEGIDVLMLDKETWPRDKPCGDIIKGVEPFFKDMGIWDEVLEHVNPITGYTMYGRDEIETTFDMGMVSSYCIPRRLTDDFTRRAAIKKGADFIENFDAIELIKKKGQVIGVKGYHAGKLISLYADIIVLACGSHSLLSRQIGIFTEDEELVYYAARGYFKNLNNVDKHKVTKIHHENFAPSGYIWMCPIKDSDVVNVGIFIAERTLQKWKGMRLEDIIPWWKDNTKTGQLHLANAKEIGPIQGWRIPTSRELGKNYGSGVLVVGDAANDVETWQGIGYTQAVQSGPVVASVSKRALATNDFTEEFLSVFHDEVGKILNPFITNNATLSKFAFKDAETIERMLKWIRSKPQYPKININEAFVDFIKMETTK